MANDAGLSATIPGYEIKRLLGRGGMATVYLAREIALQRDVALKIMKASLAADDDFRLRFLNEGHIIAQLNHPNIVTIYDIGVHEHHYYLAMSYLPGGSLKTRIQRGLSVKDSVAIIKQLANALGYAHHRGYIHRDIKPLNVLFNEDDIPVLTDFGIAKTIRSDTQITRVGMTVGSGNYMSPEQALGKAVDNRADIYSLGVMFWEMLTGTPPYQANDAVALALQHATASLPVLPKQLSELQPILHKLLAKNPELRFANTDEFLQALNQLPAALLSSAPGDNLLKPQSLPPARAMKRRSRQPLLVTSIVALPLLLLGAGIGYFAPQFFANLDIDLNQQLSQRINESLRQRQNSNTTPAQPQPPAAPADNTENRPDQAAVSTVITTTDQEQPPAQQPSETSKNQQLGKQYLSNAQELFARGAISSSLEQVKKGLQLLPANSELMALQRQLQQQQQTEQQTQTQIAELLQKAEQHWRAGNIIQPGAANAFEHYRQVLALDPNNLQARSRLITIGRLQLGAKYQQQAEQQLAQGAVAKSLATIATGLRFAPEYPGLLELQRQIQNQNQP